MGQFKIGDRIQLKYPSKMDYYGETCNDILDIFKKKGSDKLKIEWFEKILAVLEEWYKENEDEACEYAKKKVIPAAEKLIDKCEIEYMNDFFSLYKRVYAFCGRNDLECFIDYMEFEKSNKVLAKRRSMLLPFIDALNRLDKDTSRNCYIRKK